VGTDAWTVELAVPLADVGIAGAFGFNVCRERRPMETLELSCWSPTGGAFGSPERFGVATLGGAWIGQVQLPPARLGTNRFAVTLTNESDQERAVRPELRLAEQQRGYLLEPEPVVLAPKSQVERTYAYEAAGDRPLAMTFRVLDAETGDLLAERTLAPTVLPPLAMTLAPRMYYVSETRGTARIEVSVAEQLRKDTRLELALTDARGKRALRAEALPRLQGDTVAAVIDLSGVPEGTYQLRARLLTGKTPLAEASAPLTRLRGPFD
jgi:hypothetical protein